MKAATIHVISQAFMLTVLWFAMGTKSLIEWVLFVAVAASFVVTHSSRLMRSGFVNTATTLLFLVIIYYLLMPDSVGDWFGLVVVGLLLLMFSVYRWSSHVSRTIEDALDGIDPSRRVRKRLALMFWPMLLVFAVFLLVYSFQNAEPVSR